MDKKKLTTQQLRVVTELKKLLETPVKTRKPPNRGAGRTASKYASLYLDEDVKRKLRDYCEKKSMTISEGGREIIENYFKNNHNTEYLEKNLKPVLEAVDKTLEIANRIMMNEGGNVEYYTVSGYCQKKKIKLKNGEAQGFGVRASKISRDENIKIGCVSDSKYGEVNTYRIDVLERLFNNPTEPKEEYDPWKKM